MVQSVKQNGFSLVEVVIVISLLSIIVLAAIPQDNLSNINVEAAAQRLHTLNRIPRLELTEAASILAEHLVTAAAIPREAIEDALHVAVAASHGMDYLLTWNCRHIANAAMRNRIADVCASSGFETR